jgi:L-seryl-tRNA(Ser) seleniumtransferase
MPRGESGSELLRRLPSVDQVLEEPTVRGLCERHGRAAVRRAVREALAAARSIGRSGDEAGLDAALASIPSEVAGRAARASSSSLRRVINATGVVVHTNLGRAPLSASAARRVAELAAGYSNLEYDLEEGRRGSREAHAEARLEGLLGAEAALVVNNNAAAVLLAIDTLAEGREVLISRGELVEIGGSFRIPDVLRKGGARLREVGTTNRTRISDYESALGGDSALLLRVHRSNFDIVGFTASPRLGELVELAGRAGIPLVEDLGSGLLEPWPALGNEPAARVSLEMGVDLVTFSGDKLLGGPQAGVAAGRRYVVDAMRRNPLYRALRVDKMTLAALDAVLVDHASGEARARVPALRMLALDAEALRDRASKVAAALAAESPELTVELRSGRSAVGGGAAPTVELATVLIAVRHPVRSPDALSRALRAGEPAVVARVGEGALLLDLRTVDPDEEPDLLRALRRACA